MKEIIEFWDKALSLSDEQKKEMREYSSDEWRDLAPSEKLFDAAASLGSCRKVLDYGCGNAWAGIIAANSGCGSVTAVDPAKGAADTAKLYVETFGIPDRMEVSCVDTQWLKTVPDRSYDGLICSNVLDVILPEDAEFILREMSRIVTDDARVIIGMNHYISPEEAKEKSIDLGDGNCVYVDGVLRLVSRSDEEWTDILGRYLKVIRVDHFAWPGETSERRRLFFLGKA